MFTGDTWALLAMAWLRERAGSHASAVQLRQFGLTDSGYLASSID